MLSAKEDKALRDVHEDDPLRAGSQASREIKQLATALGGHEKDVALPQWNHWHIGFEMYFFSRVGCEPHSRVRRGGRYAIAAAITKQLDYACAMAHRLVCLQAIP